MHLGQTQTGLAVHLVLDLYKNQIPRTPGLVFDRGDARTLLHRVAHSERL